jgi:hypothetical protein
LRDGEYNHWRARSYRGSSFVSRVFVRGVFPPSPNPAGRTELANAPQSAAFNGGFESPKRATKETEMQAVAGSTGKRGGRWQRASVLRAIRRAFDPGVGAYGVDVEALVRIWRRDFFRRGWQRKLTQSFGVHQHHKRGTKPRLPDYFMVPLLVSFGVRVTSLKTWMF